MQPKLKSLPLKILDDTDDRWVVYSSYDTDDEQTDRVPDHNPPLEFSYAPSGFIGYTFRVRTNATITATREQLFLSVSTDPNG